MRYDTIYNVVSRFTCAPKGYRQNITFSMLKKREIQVLEKFNRRQLKKTKISFRQAQKIFSLMHQEFLSLKAYKNIGPLETIDTEIKIAKILNSLR